MAASNNGLILSAICFTRAKVLIFFQITVATPQKKHFGEPLHRRRSRLAAWQRRFAVPPKAFCGNGGNGIQQRLKGDAIAPKWQYGCGGTSKHPRNNGEWRRGLKKRKKADRF